MIVLDDQPIRVVAMLWDGSSMHSITRMIDLSFRSAVKLPNDAGPRVQGLSRPDKAPSYCRQ
jgi:hypothetical protein